MAVDRGGLRYTIEVRDQFSKQLKRFRSEIAAIKTELGGLRSAQSGLNATRRQSSSAQAGADRAQLERMRSLQAGIKQQAEVEGLRARINRTQRREASQDARKEIELFRRRKTEEAKSASTRASALRRQQAAQRKANAEVRKGAGDFNRLARSARRSEGAINRVSFTFRRLFGIFAAFQAARAGADLFRGGILQGITFNRTIQDSTISLAALFTAAGRVTDEQGKQLEGAKAFAAAQGEARRQTNLLRQDALGTTATFQELLRAFQAGVGPGLEAGLQLDEIREITVRVSQAAAALTVPQNQLIEEIRSLLRGTIQARTTIVASVLGITNEDVKKAKQAGNLFTFLQQRLGPFAEAAEAVKGSFTGLIARLRDGFAAVTGEAASGLFEKLTHSMLELFNTLVTFDEVSGAFIANADAVAAIKPLFDALAQTIDDLKAAASNLNLGNVTAAMRALGQGLRFLVNLGTGAIQGLIAGVSDLARAFGFLSSEAGGIKLETLSRMLGLVVRIGTVMVGVNLAIGGMKLVFLALVGPVLAVGRAVNGIAVTMAALAGTTKGMALVLSGGVLLALVAVGVVLKGVINDFAGFNVSIVAFFRIIADGFINLVTVVATTANLIFQSVQEGVIGLFSNAVAFILRSVAKALLEIQQAVALFSDDAGKGVLQASDQLFNAANTLSTAARRSAAEIKDAEDSLALASIKFWEDLNKAINDDADGLTPTAGDIADNFLATLTDTIGGGIDDIFAGLFGDEPGGGDAEGAAGDEGEKAGKAFVEGFDRGANDEEKKGKLETFFSGIVENFESGLSLIRPIVQQLSSFIADSIVDALDPTTDTDLLDRFARFLQAIAKMIIQQLVQIAIAKAVLGLISSGTGGTGAQLGQAAGGLAEGGEVPDGNGVPKMARPKGLDPRDTTPIFAQPGEFMMKLAAVKRYGNDAMDAINRGLIDPTALNALLGKRTKRMVSGISSRGPRGYAEGGIIQSATDGAVGSGAAAAASEGPQMAALVANDQTMEKLMAGGSQAFKNYLRDNAQEVDGILRQGRSGG